MKDVKFKPNSLNNLTKYRKERPDEHNQRKWYKKPFWWIVFIILLLIIAIQIFIIPKIS